MSSCIVLVCSGYAESRTQVEKYCRPKIELLLLFISCHSPQSEDLKQASFIQEQSILFWLHNKSLFSKVLLNSRKIREKIKFMYVCMLCKVFGQNGWILAAVFSCFINLAFIFFHTKTERTWPIYIQPC